LSLSYSSSGVLKDFASKKEDFSKVTNFNFLLALRYTLTNCSYKGEVLPIPLENSNLDPNRISTILISAINAQYIGYQIAG